MSPTHTLLAGDVGGTKTLFGVFTSNGHRPTSRVIARYSTRDYEDVDTALTTFLHQHAEGLNFDAAVFGVAGPVRGEACNLTNVPWRVESARIAHLLKVAPTRVRLLNDLEAMGYAVPLVQPDELVTLQSGNPDPIGNAALIAPGTGLGECVLHRVDGRFRPTAGEPGHTDFAPRTDAEVAFLQRSIEQFGRASWEHVLSGTGLTAMHTFMHDGATCAGVPRGPSPPLPEEISASAMKHRCSRCVDTLELFVGTLGAEAGNLALRALATAGVYIAGGIVPNILPALESETFMAAFRAKAPMEQLMADLPLHVVLTAHPALLGAAVVAVDLAEAAVSKPPHTL